MPRNYVKKADKVRPYGSSTNENLGKAMEEVKNGTSINQAAVMFNVKRTTLSDHLRKTMKKVGRPTPLMDEEEEVMSRLIDEVAGWGFLVGKFELKIMVKDLLDRKKMKSSIFTDNLPDDDWVQGFIKWRNLTSRMTSNIRRSRSAINSEVINDFFDEVENSFEGVDISPSNIFNYDKTNVVDDPCKQMVIVRRGRRRVEKVQDHSKTGFSLMWCGSASGAILPPMTVYKAQHMYEGWLDGAPSGSHFHSTPSGWFDSDSFGIWFEKIFLPQTEHLAGPKILFGDNLASHFNPDVVNLASINNVFFIMLPPNSTNLTQPLDVSVYGPMKRVWRTILQEWRNESRATGSIPKELFPMLLSRLNRSIQSTITANLISGFRTCGLYPVDHFQVLKKLPESEETSFNEEHTISILNDTLINVFKERRRDKKRENEERN